MIINKLNRVPLESVYNVRSFGGYELRSIYGVSAGVSKHGVFYRSGKVTTPTKKDVDIIVNKMKIGTIFDLRGEHEKKEEPNYFKNHKDIKVVEVDLFVELDDRTIDKLSEENKDENSMALIYVAMVEDVKEKIKYIIEAMADALDDGAILYHCSAGKDRAGVVSVLLQAIAGMEKEDIIADFSISSEVLGEHGTHFIHLSKPSYIEFLLRHLEKKYSGVAEYLESINVKKSALLKIKKALTKGEEEFLETKDRDLSLRRLNLKTIKNFRSIGGYPIKEDGITNHGVYYRSGLPHEIEKDDLRRIKDLNIKTIIDLRSQMEQDREPNGFLQDDFFKVINIDLMGELDPMALMNDEIKEKYKDLDIEDRELSKDAYKDIFQATDNIMGQLYVYLLDKKPELIFKTIKAIIEGFKEGGVLVHCTAGKDRTGTISMLINMIIEMETRDIISDFQVSEIYLNFPESHFAYSKPEYIKMAIDYLENKRGGGKKYLKEIGLVEEDFKSIKKALVI